MLGRGDFVKKKETKKIQITYLKFQFQVTLFFFFSQVPTCQKHKVAPSGPGHGSWEKLQRRFVPAAGSEPKPQEERRVFYESVQTGEENARRGRKYRR